MNLGNNETMATAGRRTQWTHHLRGNPAGAGSWEVVRDMFRAPTLPDDKHVFLVVSAAPKNGDGYRFLYLML